MLDHVILLMSQSDTHQNWTVDQVRRCIIPPVNFNQCAGIVEDGYLMAWVSWGFLSEEKADIFLEGKYSLQPEDWRSGNVLIFMDAIAPFGHMRKLSRMCRNLFPDYPKAEWRRHRKQKRVSVNV